MVRRTTPAPLLLGKDDIERIFRKYVFKFISNDIARVISRAHSGPSENLLCAVGLMTYTEFLGWLDRRISGIPERKYGENRECFELFLRQMGPRYRALLDGGYDVWKHFRNALVHEYAVREEIDVFLPAQQAVCGIQLDPKTGRYGLWCGRYFKDFYAAADAVYHRHTGRKAPRRPVLRPRFGHRVARSP